MKAAKAAVAPLDLKPVEPGSDRAMLADDLELFLQFKVPKKPVYAVISSMDSMFLLRRNLSALLTPEAGKQKVYGDKGTCELGKVSDLNSNAILDRGSIIGLWEYDPVSSSIAWRSFAPPDKALRDCIVRTETFIRDQLGDARTFSLDSPKSRVPRIEALRGALSRT